MALGLGQAAAERKAYLCGEAAATLALSAGSAV